jgi:hypothetical protein
MFQADGDLFFLAVQMVSCTCASLHFEQPLMMPVFGSQGVSGWYALLYFKPTNNSCPWLSRG